MQAKSEQRSLGDVIQTAIADAMLLVRHELHLAAVETRPKLARAGTGAGLLAAAATIALGAFGALTVTLIFALMLIVQPWLAALIVTIVYGIAAAAIAQQGIAALKKAGSLVPVQTLQTLKEDVVVLRASVEHVR